VGKAGAGISETGARRKSGAKPILTGINEIKEISSNSGRSRNRNREPE
jgi:hypothetical protein